MLSPEFCNLSLLSNLCACTTTALTLQTKHIARRHKCVTENGYILSADKLSCQRTRILQKRPRWKRLFEEEEHGNIIFMAAREIRLDSIAQRCNAGPKSDACGAMERCQAICSLQY